MVCTQRGFRVWFSGRPMSVDPHQRMQLGRVCCFILCRHTSVEQLYEHFCKGGLIYSLVFVLSTVFEIGPCFAPDIRFKKNKQKKKNSIDLQ